MIHDMVRFTQEQLQEAADKIVDDIVAPGLDILLVGINPGLWTAATGHHFARPGNRFWRALHEGGLTPRLLRPDEQQVLLDWGIGITNVVPRASARADEISAQEFETGAKELERKIHRYQPAIVAFLGLGAYRTAFDRPKASVGLQPEQIAGAHVWVLPNPSGLNAHYRREDFARLFADLKEAAQARREL